MMKEMIRGRRSVKWEKNCMNRVIIVKCVLGSSMKFCYEDEKSKEKEERNKDPLILWNSSVNIVIS